MYKRKGFGQIDWHLTEIEEGRQIQNNVGSIRSILESIDGDQ